MITNLEPGRAPWRLFAVLCSALLIGAIALTAIDHAPVAPRSQTADTMNGVPVAAGTDDVPSATAQAVAGSWTLSFDWGCDGSYSTTSFTAAANGTWSSGGGYTGLWVSVAGMLTYTFDDSETTYSGVMAAKSVTGIQTTFTGTNGCFYLLQSGTPAPAAAADSRTEQADEAGRS